MGGAVGPFSSCVQNATRCRRSEICLSIYLSPIAAHGIFTFSEVVFTASLEAVTEGLRSVDIMEGAVDSLGLGTAAGWGGAALTTEAFETAA